MDPFASVTQYRTRYPADDTPNDVLNQCLLDATDVMCAEMDQCNIDYVDKTEAFSDRLMRVCRAMAHRALGDTVEDDDGPPIPYGASQFSMGAGIYTRSATLANPYGDLFMTDVEKRSLGIGTPKACVISPYG